MNVVFFEVFFCEVFYVVFVYRDFVRYRYFRFVVRYVYRFVERVCFIINFDMIGEECGEWINFYNFVFDLFVLKNIVLLVIVFRRRFESRVRRSFCILGFYTYWFCVVDDKGGNFFFCVYVCENILCIVSCFFNLFYLCVFVFLWCVVVMMIYFVDWFIVCWLCLCVVFWCCVVLLLCLMCCCCGENIVCIFWGYDVVDGCCCVF